MSSIDLIPTQPRRIRVSVKTGLSAHRSATRSEQTWRTVRQDAWCWPLNTSRIVVCEKEKPPSGPGAFVTRTDLNPCSVKRSASERRMNVRISRTIDWLGNKDSNLDRRHQAVVLPLDDSRPGRPTFLMKARSMPRLKDGLGLSPISASQVNKKSRRIALIDGKHDCSWPLTFCTLSDSNDFRRTHLVRMRSVWSR